jgi:hypothetical protein
VKPVIEPSKIKQSDDEIVIHFSHGEDSGNIRIIRLDSGELMIGCFHLTPDVQVAAGWLTGKETMAGAHLRELSPAELADLPEEWENPTVDISKYYQCVTQAWETNEETYLKYRENGHLCMKYGRNYYVA